MAFPVLQVTTDEVSITLHLDHSEVARRLEVGEERWELLDSGVVAKRAVDGSLLGHSWNCRASDIAGGLTFCQDGRVLGPAGAVGRMEPYPRMVAPFGAGWIAIVWTDGGMAIQRLGGTAVPMPHMDELPRAWTEQGGAMIAAFHGIIERIDPSTGTETFLGFHPLRVDAIVSTPGGLVARGRIDNSERIAPDLYEFAVPDPSSANFPVDIERHDSRLRRIGTWQAPVAVRDQAEIVGFLREVRSTRWGIFAFGLGSNGGQILGTDGWRDIDVPGVEWTVGADGEIYLLVRASHGVQVRRWTPGGVLSVVELPDPPGSVLGLFPDQVFLGPDGRWWTVRPNDQEVLSFDRGVWGQLGRLPVNGLAVRGVGPDVIYARVERELWRLGPSGFAKVSGGVAVVWTPEGAVTWDGRQLRRGDAVLLDDPTLRAVRVHRDGCGRLWLVGQDVAYVEGGVAHRVVHPMLEARGNWRFGDGTPTGVVLSDLGLVVQVDRACQAR